MDSNMKNIYEEIFLGWDMLNKDLFCCIAIADVDGKIKVH